MKMVFDSRLPVTLAALILFCLVARMAAGSDQDPPPNLLLVLVDDMGYSDIGCYGGEIQTPTLDQLAEGGVRLARFYNGAQCCPSRASLLTGLYPHQAGMGDMNAKGPSNAFWAQFDNPAYMGFKREGIVTIAEVLQNAGYETFMSGKWHLADDPEAWPYHRGFDRTFSLIIGASEHFTGYGSWRSHGPIVPFSHNGQRVEALPDDFYSTDTFTDYAIEFIEATAPGKPWFGYLAYSAPHWPIQAHPWDVAKYEGVYDDPPEAIRARRFARLKALGLVPPEAVLPELGPEISQEAIEAKPEERKRWMETYAAMIDCVDQNLQRIVSLLEARGELENTLILFMSDNGADMVRGPLWGQTSNTPFRKSKVWVHEGGITTPLIVHWPAGIPEHRRGTIEGGYGHFIDIAPTLYEAAGATHPTSFDGQPVLALEGISLLPALKGQQPLPNDRPLFFERQGNEAIRLGDWKLVRPYNEGKASGDPDGIGERTGQWELYHLAVDPGETHNLAQAHPERVAELKSAWEAWASEAGVIPREKAAAIIREWRKQ